MARTTGGRLLVTLVTASIGALLATGVMVLAGAGAPPPNAPDVAVPTTALTALKTAERAPSADLTAGSEPAHYRGWLDNVPERAPEAATELEADVERPAADPPSPWILGQCMDLDTLEPVSSECEQLRRDFPAAWEQVRQEFLALPAPTYPDGYDFGIAGMDAACNDGHAQACADLDHELGAETRGVECADGNIDACIPACIDYGDVLACDRAGMANPWDS